MTYPLGGRGVVEYSRITGELFAASPSGSNFLSSSSSNFSFGSTDFAFNFWFKINDTSADQYILSKSLNTGNQRSYFIAFDTANKRITWKISRNGIATYEVTSSTVVLQDTWYMCSVFKDFSNEILGISISNGTITTTPTSDPTLFTSSQDFEIGRINAGGIFGDIEMDSLSVYNKIFTQPLISTLHNSGNGVTYDDQDKVGMQNHYKMNEETGARVDFHGSDDLTDNSSVSRSIGKILD